MRHEGWGLSALDLPEQLKIGWGFRGIDCGNAVDIPRDRKAWATAPEQSLTAAMNQVLAQGLAKVTPDYPAKDDQVVLHEEQGLVFTVLRRGGYVYGAIHAPA